MATNEQVGAALDARPTGVRRVARWHPLSPVVHRRRWIALGLLVQLVAVGGLAGWAYSRYKKDAALGMAAKATVTLVWQEALHTRQGIAVLVATAVVFAVGSVITARPFARTVEMLVAVVPAAAIVGLAVLGVIAIVLAIVVFLAWAGVDGGGGGGGGGGGRRTPAPGQESDGAVELG